MEPIDAQNHLQLFKRQYLQLLGVDLIVFPPRDVIIDAHFQSSLFDQIFKPGVLQHPPPERYQLRVLKALSTRIEESIVDPDEEVGLPVSLFFSNRHRTVINASGVIMRFGIKYMKP